MGDLRYIHIPLELWGAFFCIVAAWCVLAEKHYPKRAAGRMLGWLLLSNAVLLVADTLAWFFRGHATAVGFVFVRVSNFIVFESNYIMLVYFARYLYWVLPEENRKAARPYLRVIDGICAIAAIALVISQFTDWFYYIDAQNFYHRTGNFWMPTAMGLLGMIVLLIMFFHNRSCFTRNTCIAVILYTTIPVAASLVQLLIYGIAILNIGITVACLLAFLTFEVEQAKERARMDRELAEMRMEILLAQMQPHFLFNSLQTIKHLVKKDQKDAVTAIDAFSDCLRAEINSLSEHKCIPFSEELVHVKSYLLLENRRFGDKLQVVYDIQEEGFMIPPLTVQPIVENAVRHGIRRRNRGGTIWITTTLQQGHVKITVRDDGVGFDPSGKPDEGRVHVGLQNVKARVEAICEGELTVDSKPGSGTLVTIMIPVMKRNDG